MQNPSHHTTSFQVYNASAGSGKTFSLVKEYLKILLKKSTPYAFQQILAITFTNKAADEMKERVLENLHDFSQKKETGMLPIICEELQITEEAVFEKSKVIIASILQNYSAFSITTIDAFTHKLIRTFAYDLGLSMTFDVEMNSESLLQEAVDTVLSKIGIDKELTKILVSYALRKTDEDKTWDISLDLFQFSKLLLNENEFSKLQQLQRVEVTCFIELKDKLSAQNEQLAKEFKKIGETALELIFEHNLQEKDFNRGALPKHFRNLVEQPDRAKFFDESALKKAIDNQDFYRKTLPDDIKNTIDRISNQLTDLYHRSENVYRKKAENTLVLQSLIPLAVLKYIYQALQALKEDKDVLLNAEFNEIIYKSIKNEPAPFIYERLGEKYRHYFIDEMQDTSVLQWQNMLPLLHHALNSENELGDTGSLLLVGDGKQSIYRWRGGKAEQFIELSSSLETVGANPFGVAKRTQNLDTNYRSYSEIISFNNKIFTHLANFLSKESYCQLFKEGNQQKTTDKEGGYVQLSFVEKQKGDEEKDLVFAKKVEEIILNLGTTFKREEICVLVRSKRHGVAVANYLSERAIPIVSSETLLIKNSAKVQFIIHLLQLVYTSVSQESKFQILYFLFDHYHISTPKHTFLTKYLALSTVDFFKELKQYGTHFSLSVFLQMPFFESISYIVESFCLIESPEAEVQFFLDIVFEHSQQQSASVNDFLAFWEHKKESLSMITPEVPNAVKIMTIHKSKGLEYPVVIFPYDLDIYREKEAKIWYDFEKEMPINPILLPYKKELKHISEQGNLLYQRHREQLELDNFNLLYVAMTRAVEQLYVVQEKKISAKGGISTNSSSGLFIDFLQTQQLWEKDKNVYHFGSLERKSKPKEKNTNIKKPRKFIQRSWEKHQIKVVQKSIQEHDDKRGEASFKGRQLHQILSKVKTGSDLAFICKQLAFNGVFTEAKTQVIEQILRAVVNHPELQPYFEMDIQAFNERKLTTATGENLIPDRVVFLEKGLVIIDYKTGTPKKEDLLQVHQYEKALQQIGYKVIEKILVYIDLETAEINLTKI